MVTDFKIVDFIVLWKLSTVVLAQCKFDTCLPSLVADRVVTNPITRPTVGDILYAGASFDIEV